MFQKKKITRFRLYIFFLLFVLFFIKFSTTSVYANTYKIIDLEISESYDLNFNKQNVIDSAFQMAFKELIAKITISEDKKNLNSTNLKLIKSLVDSFTIVDEKFIENKYFAKFDVDFNKKKVFDEAFKAAYVQLISAIITSKDKKKIKGFYKYVVHSFDIRRSNASAH